MRADALIHRPTGPLADFVECIWFWKNGNAPELKERVIPSGTLAMVVNLEADRLRIGDRYDAERSDAYRGIMISGAHAGYFVIHSPPHATVMGVHFKPGGAFPFLGVEAGELENAHTSLEALWGARAPRLRDRLLEAGGNAERARLLETSLLEGAARPLERRPDVALALAAIEDPHLSSVAELRVRTGLSAKRLIALFRDEVGIAPKAFWRIRRFQVALRLIERARAPRGADIAAQLGYFDQAHMLRDFRAFTGLSPRDYLRAGVDRPNHVPHSTG